MVCPSHRRIIKRAGQASIPPLRRLAGGSPWPPPPHLLTSWITILFTEILAAIKPLWVPTGRRASLRTEEGPTHSPALNPPSPRRGTAVIKGLQARALKAPTYRQPSWCSRLLPPLTLTLPFQLQLQFLKSHNVPPSSHRLQGGTKTWGQMKRRRPPPPSPPPPSSPPCRAQVRVQSHL